MTDSVCLSCKYFSACGDVFKTNACNAYVKSEGAIVNGWVEVSKPIGFEEKREIYSAFENTKGFLSFWPKGVELQDIEGNIPETLAKLREMIKGSGAFILRSSRLKCRTEIGTASIIYENDDWHWFYSTLDPLNIFPTEILKEEIARRERVQ